MAMNFGAASKQYLVASYPVVTAPPFTMVAWVNAATIPSGANIMAIDDGNPSGANNFTLFQAGFGGNIAASTTASGSGGGSVTAGTLTAGIYAHAGAVFTSSSSRTAYLNGSAAASDSTSLTPINIAATRIGASSENNQYYDGSIAEAAIYNVALSPTDMAALAGGMSPLRVRSSALVAYWPMLGYESPAIDRIGRIGLSLVNGVTAATHPRIFYLSNKTDRWLSTLPTASQATTTNGVPQAVTLGTVKCAVVSQAVTANGVPQAASLATAFVPFAATVPIVTIAGAVHTSDLLWETLRVEQHTGEQPATCTFTTVANPSIVPTVNMDVQIGLGNVVPSNLLFGGRILTVDQIYKDVQTNVAYDVTCQDYSWILNARRPFKAYVATAGATIVSDMVANYSSGVTTNLPALPVASISFDGNADFTACLTRLITQLIGEHFLVDPSKVLQVFATTVPGTAPATIDSGNIAPSNPNGARKLAITTDLSQLRNKIWVEGGSTLGGSATVVSPGMALSTTTLPLTQSAGFSPSGYCVLYLPIAGTYPVIFEKFICKYASVNQGSLVSAPSDSPVFASTSAGGSVATGNYVYLKTYVTSAGETGGGPVSATVSVSGPGTVNLILGAVPSDLSVTKINIYRTVANGSSALVFLDGSVTKPAFPGVWPNPIPFADTVSDAGLGASPPSSGSPCPEGSQPPATALTQLPGLNGVTSLTGTLPAIPAGATVNVASVYDGSAGSPYGVREYWLSDQECITPALCQARALAEYTLFGHPLVSAAYQTRDVTTRAGKTVTISLGAPTNVSQSLLIQNVVITQFVVPNTYPLFEVKASSTKFTLQDLLRRLGGLLTINGVLVGAA